MAWVYPIELLVLLVLAWRIGGQLKRIADILDRGGGGAGDDDGEA
jgi:hypothetical protein